MNIAEENDSNNMYSLHIGIPKDQEVFNSNKYRTVWDTNGGQRHGNPNIIAGGTFYVKVSVKKPTDDVPYYSVVINNKVNFTSPVREVFNVDTANVFKIYGQVSLFQVLECYDDENNSYEEEILVN